MTATPSTASNDTNDAALQAAIMAVAEAGTALERAIGVLANAHSRDAQAFPGWDDILNPDMDHIESMRQNCVKIREDLVKFYRMQLKK